MRDRYLDASKGVLIVAVVLGHFLEGWAPAGPFTTQPGWNQQPYQALLTFIYLFHMPLFIALAGVTARSGTAFNRAVGMVALYAPLQVIQIQLYGRELTWDTFVRPSYALWFILALAVWLLLLPLVDLLPRLTLLASVALAVIAGLSDFDPSTAYTRAIFYFPFFVAGHVYGKRLLERYRGAKVPWRLLAALVALAVAAVYSRSDVSPYWPTGQATLLSLDVDDQTMLLGRAATLAAMAVTSVAILAVLPRSGRVLEALGQRSLGIYVMHQFVVLELRPDIPDWTRDQMLAACFGLTVATVLVAQLPPFDRFFRDWAKMWGDAATKPFSLLRRATRRRPPAEHPRPPQHAAQP